MPDYAPGGRMGHCADGLYIRRNYLPFGTSDTSDWYDNFWVAKKVALQSARLCVQVCLGNTSRGFRAQRSQQAKDS